ncbi:30S ribosomal protein S4 [Candidatus Gottesmanbacteria bacterium RIFCSPLOWO2_01_FULL_43_11b]|uniref:Small ribosomal subunit protein uS4 n=1 Tax=Candidatus Gottesmanbacteria bacterium RIFCSPLOWO2_01_FULL_43_11b TaxID=1798392 RepID=A0A1F6AHY0_9BACT|nr:MAG: 30S ribosomal protein S4 [Candidatus Gottesmanbacteria bacterium RIFCSPLOWO2_01_FULL_43_11b]
MARYTGPKNRLARREGLDLGLKTIGSKSHASLLRRLNIPPGQHGARGKRKQSDYGLQLREKQKVKRIYGVLERQFRRYFEHARKWRGNTGEKLLEFLERRLDNTVFRAGLAPTRASARQLISHGHVLVNGKKVTIPSYSVTAESVISLKSKALEIPAVKKMIDEKTFTPPEWISRQGPVGKVDRVPVRTDVKEDITEQFIVEHYSR